LCDFLNAVARQAIGNTIGFYRQVFSVCRRADLKKTRKAKDKRKDLPYFDGRFDSLLNWHKW
jgi:hypothetical protein